MTVYYTLEPNTPLTPEQIKRLDALAAMPDSVINFDDIPEVTPERLEKMLKDTEAHKKKLAQRNA